MYKCNKNTYFSSYSERRLIDFIGTCYDYDTINDVILGQEISSDPGSRYYI